MARRAFTSAVWAAVEAGRATGLPYAEMGRWLHELACDVNLEQTLLVQSGAINDHSHDDEDFETLRLRAKASGEARRAIIESGIVETLDRFLAALPDDEALARQEARIEQDRARPN